ncbi:MAG: ABC transporter substrate-binding protein [Anaerolineae bacterium]|nr:ABC transporter substrate-binding protein [Anaerolineae bacterium]
MTVDYLDEPTVVDLVAANENQFGVVSGEQVILAASQGRPIVYVYEWFQQYPIGVVYSADMEVTSFADFADLRVGIPGRFGANYSGLTTFLDTADMSETDISVQEIGFNAPEVFCVGAVDAAVIYVNNEPLQIRNRAQQGDCGAVADVNVLQISDVVDLVSNGIITNQQTIDENPELVQAMVSAYNNALELIIANPARAYLLSAPFIEGLPLDDDLRVELETLADEQDMFLESDPDMDSLYASHQAMYETLSSQFDADTLIQFEVLLASIPLWNAERLGFSDLASWENMQATLVALGQLDEPIALETIFTNDFLPASD